jgi:hypothetical protein
MKQRFTLVHILPVLLLVVSLTSCEAIGGIFKAGMWSGIIVVAIVVALIIFIITRLGKRN